MRISYGRRLLIYVRGGFDVMDDRQLAKVCPGPVRGCMGDLTAPLGISTLTNSN